MTASSNGVLGPSLSRKHPGPYLFPIGCAAMNPPLDGHAMAVVEIRQIQTRIAINPIELATQRLIRANRVEQRSIVLLWRSAVVTGLSGRRDHTVHERMESPPQMLQAAGDLRTVNHVGQVMMNMQTCRDITACSDVSNDIQGGWDDAFYVFPDHRIGLSFDLRPSQAMILGLVTERCVVLNRKQAVMG